MSVLLTNLLNNQSSVMCKRSFDITLISFHYISLCIFNLIHRHQKTGWFRNWFEWVAPIANMYIILLYAFNTFRPTQNCRHFADDIFLNENAWILRKVSLKSVLKIRVNNIPTLIQIMAWRRPVPSYYLNQWWLVYWRVYVSEINKCDGICFPIGPINSNCYHYVWP